MRLIACLILLVSLSIPALAAPPGELPTIAILESKSNQEAYKEAGLDFARGVRYWAAQADALGHPFRLIDDEALTNGISGAALLIVSGAPILSDAQVAGIEKFHADGGALLLVGMPGHLGVDGTERAAPPALGLADLMEVKTFDPEVTDASSFVVRLGTPMGPALEPALRFEVDWAGAHWTATSQDPEGCWVDWGMAPLLGEPKTREASTAVSLVDSDEGRIAWLGTPPDAITELNNQTASGKRMTLQLLRWLLHRPSVHVGWWPLGLRAATVVTADVETRFETGEAIALMFHREAVRGSFFLLGDLAAEYPYVVEALAANGDVGSHSMHHLTFQGRTVEDQQAEIHEAMAQLNSLGVRRVDGFRPPMEEFDAATLEAVAGEGLDFLYGNLSYDRSWPIQRTVGEHRIWQFARIVPDDYNFATHHNVDGADGYTEHYIRWAQRIFDLGGLYLFSFHTNYLGLDENVETIGRYLRWVKHQRVWIATFRDIVRWVEAREAVEVKISDHPETVEVNLRNNAREAITGFPLIYQGSTDGPPLLVTTVEGLTVRKREDRGYVVLVDLAPGEAKTIILQPR